MHNKIISSIKQNISSVIIGKDSIIDLLLTAMICEGHVLLEDVPGTGKTVLAKTMAKSINSAFHRIQFTPDLLPSDVTGLNYFNQKDGEFTLKKGPIFCNILLADEINRATPRTQSSLLECMEEKQVTIDGVTFPLEPPFFVIATQNPIETGGTFPLPEAQLDRFLFQLSMGLPTKEEELSIINRFMNQQPLKSLQPVCSLDDIQLLINHLSSIFVHPILLDYIADIAQKTRNHPSISNGISPRGTLALLKASRGFAMVKGRDYVIPEDIKACVIPVCAHRIATKYGSSATTNAQVISELLKEISLPTEDWSKV